MSDEIDLDQSHLCTTEDAFEKFQAVSMYEEDEFITLSDIVPPEPPAPEFDGEMSDIPYENEVVLDSLEEQVPEVNSTIEISLDENLSSETNSNQPQLSMEVPTPKVNESQPLKRGRKKKIQQDTQLTTDIDDTKQQNGSSDSMPQSSEAIPATPFQGKRGRRPINARQTPESSVTADTPTGISDIPTDVPKNTSRGRLPKRKQQYQQPSQSNNDTQNEESTPKKTAVRRGRNKKSISEQQLVQTDSLNDKEEQDLSINNKIDTCLLEKPVPKARGRKKKAVLESRPEIGVEENKELGQSATDLIENQTPSIEEAFSIRKTTGKRGRPKKMTTDVNEVKQSEEKVIKEDDGDDICLSQLKNTLDTKEPGKDQNNILLEDPKSNGIVESDLTIEISEDGPEAGSEKMTLEITEEDLQKNTPTKRNFKPSVMEDFEYNIDNVINENKKTTEPDNQQPANNSSEMKDSLLVEDTSKRPVRRKAKQPLLYDEGSDEDPFANIELSDEDDLRGRKGRYYSDDEYIPGAKKKRGHKEIEVSAESDTSDSDIDNVEKEFTRMRMKRKKDGSPMKKRGRKSKEELAAQEKQSPELTKLKLGSKNMEDNDVEICSETVLIKASDDSRAAWGSSNEFENFLAKKIQGTDIKITKASTPVQPLEIPVLDANVAKKAVEISTQTSKVPTSSTGIQTTAPYDVAMKDNVALTANQSEKACEFLNSIVKTTAELGELMTQKSEDFIKKKINTNHVTDTFKMDYCVRKSFLLFKLAKHNLMQMEEDLAQQYGDFLKTHNLSQYREKPKVIEAEQKAVESDSDCEIIEAPAPSKPKKAVPFNPKTVFLNKELSIKIAKKPTDDKKLNIKGRHTVWINDSVMVKKVKPTQSFLAQDSRNKKPPDCVTIEMVNAFFKQYYRKKALVTCAPFVSSEWATRESIYVCNYFFAKTEDFQSSAGIPSGSGPCDEAENDMLASNMHGGICDVPMAKTDKSPKTLFSLCTQVLQTSLLSCPRSCPQRKFCPSIGHNNPVTLYRLCVDSINKSISNEEIHKGDVTYITPLPLKTLCCTVIAGLLNTNEKALTDSAYDSAICTYSDESAIDSMPESPIWEYDETTFTGDLITNFEPCLNFPENSAKSLFSICLEVINAQIIVREKAVLSVDNLVHSNVTHIYETFEPKCLKSIAYTCIVNLLYRDENKPHLSETSLKKVKTLANICFKIVTKAFSDSEKQTLQEGLTIDAVNTLTEEAYHNINQSELSENADDYYADDDSNFYEDEPESRDHNAEESSNVEDNWMLKLKIKTNIFEPSSISTVTENETIEQAEPSVDSVPAITRIKLEPLDEVPETIDTSIVKSEPMPHLDEMTIIPESIITKSEILDPPATSSREPIQRQNSSSFDVDQFEAFVSTNKMMYNANNYDDDEGVFSQSAVRIRRQYEPDSDTENDMSMSLLVPQTYEHMPVLEKKKAKDILMESSSDESSNKQKVPTKKKPERKSRGKPKRNEPKPTNNKEIPKEKPTPTNEIAMLTRRMRDKIRQEEKKVASSDSEHETERITTKKGKEKLKEDTDKAKAKGSKAEETDEKEKNYLSDKVKKDTKPADDEIQCSNVDSTEQVENVPVDPRNSSPCTNDFSGFSAVDQNEISSYQKYVKYVRDQILPKDTENDGQNSAEISKQPVINPDEPVELLECEPSMPFFMEQLQSSSKAKKGKSTKKEESKLKPEKEENKKSQTKNEEKQLYVERHGWRCYPLDTSDKKLYQNACIPLEKLPESFVETYFQYQTLTDRNDEDDEVDRLTNLQTLNRASVKETTAAVKSKSKPKCKIQPQVKNAVYSILGLDQVADTDGAGDNDSRAASPSKSDHYDELTPSEDEGGKVDNETAAPVAKPSSDNNLAKNSLMDDNESDDETRIKQELKDDATDTEKPKLGKKYKPGPKSKKGKEKEPTAPMMLTADKMMNKELNLLHAPVNIDDGDTKAQIPSKGPVTRNKQKSASKTSPKIRVKGENYSSSEEEKQWVSIKERLYKKVVKKHDTTREDDAKRAKLVSEFIERRGDGAEAYVRKRRGVRGRRSKKKMLERQKQLRVLTRELFGDPSNDASLQRKHQAGSYFKGRRNIRKVIDKKSLAKSTVVANMEEFERKRRLNIKQSKLREVLRCEEGVNVLVINDEVCLEYDFEQHRPVVTIHTFFTKVMKAHQYEGVKFMWDACFESLESIAAGRPGGGCILAHCMGLGKTLQVLALLHTVLTHPGVGIHRVLVCCPLSTVLNWVDEIHKWIGPVTNQIKVFELSKLRKTYERAYQLEDWYNGGGIFIIGYELFRSLTTLDSSLDDVRPTIVNKIRTALLEPGPDVIVCDEGHLLKNDSSVLAVAMSRVATRRRVVLTGTPMQNNLREYYCMVNFVKPNLLGTYAEYSNRFENPIMNGQHRDSREEDIKLMKARTHILHKVLEGCLQRQEASVLYPYLPKKHEYTVFISLTKCQWDLYKHYLQNYGNTQNNKSILKDFHILQKIWSHPQVLHNFQMRVCDEAKAKTKVKVEKLEDDLAREDLNETADLKPSDTEVWWLQYLEGGAMLDSLTSSNKFVAVFRILDESVALGDKVLIFSTSLFTMDALEFFLKKINKWSLGQEYYRLDGSVPAEVRQKWCREFNAEQNHKTKLFLISTRAGSLGLNMTAANRVIILDTSWNPAHDIQSIFRVYRFGQKKDCYIYRLVALGTMEQKIYERSVTKQAVACRVVDEQQIDRHYNMAELTELYKFDETGVGVAGGVAVGVEDVVLLRVARDAALHAVHEHDSLLRGSGEQGLPEHERNAAWMQFQQEHANKQMQEDALQAALLAQKLKQAEELLNPPAPAAPKRRNYAKLKLAIKPEASEESNLTPMVVLPKQRGRKPKKNNVVSCCIPIQPELAEKEAPDPDTEVAMVKKIADILLEHNFQNHKTPGEISALVSRVRHIVTSGQIDLLDNTDRLTMSLANVFLQKNEPPMPALTDIAPEEDLRPPTPEPPKPTRKSGRKKGSGKKFVFYEEVPSTSAGPPGPPPTVEPEGNRTRRRAALAAEKNFDTIDSVIDLEDDDWQNEDNSQNDDNWQNDDDAPVEIIPREANAVKSPTVEISKENETRPERTSSARSSRLGKISVKKDMKKDVSHTKDLVLDDSILLSDDDEPPPPTKKPGPARKTMKTEQEQINNENGPAVPLHPTLLSNKNFIKIVAHTYLSGNPAMDEDAATLAAQYSTFKALKEYESTGRAIVSGPIYDIAVKVLGKDVLQKLQKSGAKISTSEIITVHPINSSKESVTSDVTSNVTANIAANVVAKVTSEVKEEAAKKPVKIRIRIPPLPTGLAATRAALPPAGATGVVPVGLFKRAEEGPSSTADECILPDDDDIHIISDPTPPPAPTPPAPAPALPTIRLSRRNATRMLVTKVKADPPPPDRAPIIFTQVHKAKSIVIPASSCSLVPANQYVRTVASISPYGDASGAVSSSQATPSSTAVRTSVAAPGSIAYASIAAPAAPAESILSDLNTTISLDSDDEEPAGAQSASGGVTSVMSRAPRPVPVSLTQVHPPASVRRMLRTVTVTPAKAQGPMLLNSVVAAPPVGPVPAPATNYYIVPARGHDPTPAAAPAVPVALSMLQQDAQGQAIPMSAPSVIAPPAPAAPAQVKLAPKPQPPPKVAPKPQPPPKVAPKPQPPPKVAPKPQPPPNVASNPQPLPKVVPNPQPPPKVAPKPQPPPKVAPKPQPPPKVAPKLQPPSKTPPPPPKEPKNKRLCKPGDILRITENGTIQVLKRKDVPGETSAPTPATKTGESALERRRAAPGTTLPTQPPDKSDKNLRKASSSSTSTKDDPLSIFKDVIHIEAGDYNSEVVRPVPPKPTPKTTPLQPAKSLSVPSVSSTASKPQEKWHSVLTHNATQEKNVMKKKIETNLKLKERLFEAVDLTDLDAPDGETIITKNQPKRLKGATTIVGTSKSIILCGSGKAVAKAGTAAEKRELGRPAETPLALKSKVEVIKKRPAPVETSAPKKIKTDKPMTLKDFNIDDIDDIIELD